MFFISTFLFCKSQDWTFKEFDWMIRTTNKTVYILQYFEENIWVV